MRSAKNDIFFIKEALKEAKKAEKKGEVPVGAVIVRDNEIIGRGYNQSISRNDPTAHAEILALRAASSKLSNYRLNSCKLYVTVEPCPMCAGSLIWARISKIIFGAFDKKTGACGSVIDIPNSGKFNHRPEVTGGILEKPCRSLIQRFFKKKRKKCLRVPKISGSQVKDKDFERRKT